MMKRSIPPLSVILVIGILSAALVSLTLGPTPISVTQITSAMFGGGEPLIQTIVWEVRLPRILAAFIVGSALGASGAVLQGLFRNPLAEPGVLGVSSSAALAASLTLFLGIAGASSFILPAAALAGALIATALLSLAAWRLKSITTVILLGVALTTFTGAMMTVLMNFAPHPFFLSDLMNWTLGSVANRSLWDIAVCGPIIGLGLIGLVGTRHGLTVLTLGDEAAQGVGLDLARLRRRAIAGVGLAVGGAVALAGAIGFVGIIAPHVVRPFVGQDPGRTVIPAGLLGGLILMLADLAVRLLPTANELKLGVLAAMIGAPAFVWIAARRHPFDG